MMMKYFKRGHAMIDGIGLVPGGLDVSLHEEGAKVYRRANPSPTKTLDIQIEAIPNQLMKDHSTLHDSVPQ